MKPRRTVLIALVGVALAAAAGGAIAAPSDDPEQEVLENAAERLDVSPERLREALAAARDAQLDKAVQDGRLTEEQAEELKERRGDHVLGIGPHTLGAGGPHLGFRHGPGPVLHGPHDIVEAITETLGITPRRLFEGLHGGKSLEELAKAENKTLDDIKAAVRKAASADLDKAVEDGRLTREQADDLLDSVVEGVERFGDRRPHRLPFSHGFRGPAHPHP